MAIIFTCSTDDGHPSDLKMAELLKKHNLNGTFFIPIKNREGRDVMSQSEIREIGRLFEVGSHTYDHCFLNSVDIGQAQFQVIEGKKVLEDMLGKEVSGFCYPGGRYRHEHTDLVKSAGFRYARTTMNLCFDAGKNRFEMATTCQFYPHGRSVYLRNFAKARRWMGRRAGLRLALKQANWVDRLYDLFDYACDRHAVFHLWGHSSDIDRLDAWRELELFLEYVASKVAIQDRLNNEQLASRFFLT
jgi:peptidoglycan/xylan/chitin deacetylase (PgdA/CDA1 family)